MLTDFNDNDALKCTLISTSHLHSGSALTWSEIDCLYRDDPDHAKDIRRGAPEIPGHSGHYSVDHAEIYSKNTYIFCLKSQIY